MSINSAREGMVYRMKQSSGKLYMVLDVESTSRTMTLFDPIYNDTIKHAAKVQDEIDV